MSLFTLPPIRSKLNQTYAQLETTSNRWQKTKQGKRLKKLITSREFASYYAWFALGVLLLSTAYWALLGARVQQINADQLVDPYLFQHDHTLQSANFPGQHTFLLKWPLFFLIRLFGYSASSFIVITIGCVLLTVLGLAYVLHRIERRPLVYGTLLLALASVLLLVPPQPYAGGILPVNMAMLTTRNLEYLVYIAALALIAKAPRFKSWRFYSAVALLAVLIASDQLFLSITIVAAFLALLAYGTRQRWNLVTLSINWLLSGVAGAVAGIGLILLITKLGITHVGAQTTATYGLATNAKQVVTGLYYGASGLLTNFGANPMFDAVTLRRIPHAFAQHFFGVGLIAYSVNLIILGVGLYACARIVLASFALKQTKVNKMDTSNRLALMLLWTTVSAALEFVGTNHYYSVDARYLGISLFAVFIALASYGRRQRAKPLLLVGCGAILCVSIIFGLLASTGIYHADRKAVLDVTNNDQKIADVLAIHQVDTLVGDYWRVLPVKQDSGGTQNVLPLQNCTEPRSVLTSQEWDKGLYGHSFAYLLSLDTSLTGYPPCSVQQIINAYGRPNSSALISGSLANPKELILFYDRGAHHSSPKSTVSVVPSTVLPVSLGDLPNTACSVPTVLNVVAHQDDDLLFMNPDILKAVRAGDCVRTIYVTAGDSGHGSVYWLGREQGSEAAYAAMGGFDDIWIARIVSLSDHEYVTIATPKNNTKISLIFMHLPDGDIQGQGFSTSHYESLQKLLHGKISVMHTVDGQSSYTLNDLVNVLTDLMHTFQPGTINTQSNFIGTRYPDHSDHLSVGTITQKAYADYETQQYDNKLIVPIKFYIGYPIHAMPSDLSGADLATKESVFLAYAKYDGGVCGTLEQCAAVATYGAYLSREYTNPY